MTSRQTNHLLLGAATVMGVGALAIVAAGVLLPVDGTTNEVGSRAGVTIETSTAPTSQPAGLDRLFARSFRTALDDAPTAAAKAAAAAAATSVTAAAPLQINVVGAIGTSVAILRLADGSVVARSVGDQIDGAETIRIEPASILFRRNGQDFSVVKPVAADPSAGLIVIR
jgi:hypothetical protein